MNAATKTSTIPALSTATGRNAAKRVLDAAEGWECASITITFDAPTANYEVSVTRDDATLVICFNFFANGLTVKTENGQRWPISADRAVALILARREIFVAWRAFAEAERAFESADFAARFCEDEAA